MTVGVLLLTHENLGRSLLSAAQCQIEPLPLPVAVLGVNAEAGAEVFGEALRQRVHALDTGGGVLVLVDAPGLAPHRLLQALDAAGVRIVSGLNLPMLQGLFKSSQRGLDELAAAAIHAGRQGIGDLSPPRHG
jgi:PTS system ascorbate-specific IIA component